MTGRVVGSIQLMGNRWAIRADPDIVIRIKRILPSLKTDRSAVLFVSDTETIGRDLEWIAARWQFDMSPSDRAHLTARAVADQKREELIAGIVTGSATVTPQEGWLTPAVPLRAYQRVAIDMARTSGALIIGDELGGGKTAMALGILEDPAARPALCVMLTGLGAQWLRELNKFYPELRGKELKTTKAEEEFPTLCGPDGEIAYDLILVNYAKLSKWRQHLAGKVRSVIFDEVQELRRPESLKYEAAAHIADQADINVGLSATPVYNFGGEIFAITDAMKRGSLGYRTEFIREWCGGGGKESGTMAKVSVDDPDALRMHLKSRGLFIRRTLEEMGIDIPGAMTIEQIVPSDTAKYDEFAGNAVEMAKLILSQDATSSEKWRTAAELDWRIRQATGIAKAPFVADFVRLLLESQEKVVLFGWHRAVYDVWMERLKQFKPVLYTGTESSAAKAKSLQDFILGDSRILVISLRSGAGIDGLQQVCSTLVFGELDWSPGVHRQGIGRLNRDGQVHKVLAYFCVSTDGSDPFVLDTLNIKALEAQRLTGAAESTGAQPADASMSQIKQLAADVVRRHQGRGAD